jgi:hypothetical protein
MPSISMLVMRLRTEFVWRLSLVFLLVMWAILLDVVMYHTWRQANATNAHIA